MLFLPLAVQGLQEARAGLLRRQIRKSMRAKLSAYASYPENSIVRRVERRVASTIGLRADHWLEPIEVRTW